MRWAALLLPLVLLPAALVLGEAPDDDVAIQAAEAEVSYYDQDVDAFNLLVRKRRAPESREEAEDAVETRETEVAEREKRSPQRAPRPRPRTPSPPPRPRPQSPPPPPPPPPNSPTRRRGRDVSAVEAVEETDNALENGESEVVEREKRSPQRAPRPRPRTPSPPPRPRPQSPPPPPPPPPNSPTRRRGRDVSAVEAVEETEDALENGDSEVVEREKRSPQRAPRPRPRTPSPPPRPRPQSPPPPPPPPPNSPTRRRGRDVSAVEAVETFEKTEDAVETGETDVIEREKRSPQRAPRPRPRTPSPPPRPRPQSPPPPPPPPPNSPTRRRGRDVSAVEAVEETDSALENGENEAVEREKRSPQRVPRPRPRTPSPPPRPRPQSPPPPPPPPPNSPTRRRGRDVSAVEAVEILEKNEDAVETGDTDVVEREKRSPQRAPRPRPRTPSPPPRPRPQSPPPPPPPPPNSPTRRRGRDVSAVEAVEKTEDALENGDTEVLEREKRSPQRAPRPRPRTPSPPPRPRPQSPPPPPPPPPNSPTRRRGRDVSAVEAVEPLEKTEDAFENGETEVVQRE